MDCPTCDAALLEDARFCNKCGTRIGESPAKESGAGESLAPDDATLQFQAPQPPARQAAPAEPVAFSISADWLGSAPERLSRILRLEPSVFAELRTDSSATPFSLAVAAAAIFLMGLGGYLWLAIEFEPEGEVFWKSVLVGGVIAFIAWLGWMLVAHVVLTNMYRETVRLDEIIRIGGASTAPLALSFFMFIPGITFGVAILGVVLWAVYTILALRAGLGIAVERAAVATLAGFGLWMLVMPLIVSGENPLGPGLLLFDSVKDGVADLYRTFS